MSSPIESMARGKYLELCRDGNWEYVRRVNARGAAFMLAVTEAQELVLVEQYRVPLQRRCIELPAGIVGDDPAHPGENAESAALRELEEETGFRGGRIEHLLSGPSSPGMSAEILHLFRVSDLARVGPGGGADDGEDITVHLVPLDEVHAWLQNRAVAGLAIEPRIYAGLWFAGRP